MRIVVGSLMPLVLFGVYSLIRAFISYNAPWFQITGTLFMLWAVGALLINLLREALTRGLFPISSSHGRTTFRVARIVLLYILASFAVFLGAEAFRIPDEFPALLRFVLSLSIVLASLLLLLKKKAILGVLPDLPYKGYQVFVRGLTRYYFPAIFLTFLTGILWCIGYHDLCLAIWRMTWAVVGAFISIMVAYYLLDGWLRQWAVKRHMTDEAVQAMYRALRSLLLYATIITLLIVTLKLLGLTGPVQRILSFPVLKIGGSPLSLWTLMKATLILLAFIYFSRLLRAWLDYRVHPSVGVEEGLAYAINTFLHYTLLTIGFLVALRAVGLDLRVLMVFAGAVGIGIGLGMQSTAANLIAGISLVFGRRIRKGDWIQVGDTRGNVQEVGLRATKVRTRDNIEYLIPNAELTGNTIVNYTLSDPMIRVHIPVGVSYRSNPKEVEAILLKAAAGNEKISKSRHPEVWFSEYGDSSLNFNLLVWIDVRKVMENSVRSELYFTIFEALAEAGIEIPFPQRDLHIRSGLVPSGPDPRVIFKRWVVVNAGTGPSSIKFRMNSRNRWLSPNTRVNGLGIGRRGGLDHARAHREEGRCHDHHHQPPRGEERGRRGHGKGAGGRLPAVREGRRCAGRGSYRHGRLFLCGCRPEGGLLRRRRGEPHRAGRGRAHGPVEDGA